MTAEKAVTSNYQVRRWVGLVEQTLHENGPVAGKPLVKAVCGVVIKNPFAGRYVDDLTALTEPSAALGTALGRRAVALLGGAEVESYGKGGLAGLDGEQEHVVACVTTVFGDALREAVGGGAAWISSATKTAAAGASIDIPLAYKDELYVRSHYDAATVSIPDVPRPDELFICVAVASGGRVHERVGGLTAAGALAAAHR
ncbi:amino acid synthesis family protein [Streptomyces sp. NPDC001508]|uniref:amino acid synthesis family protein n=1 Tax=Streptomyces sp. NPDC001508 TaxID=3154656 RepID=UPI0033325DCD